MAAHPQRHPHAGHPRSLGAGAGQAVLFLAGLALVFSILRLQTGIWAVPAFLPLYGWMAMCALARHTLRPAALARLEGPCRAAALLVSIGLLWLIWPLWAGPAHAAWQAAEGGFFPAGASPMTIALPHFPYGAVAGAAPLALVLVGGWVVLMAMLALPGHAEGVPLAAHRSEEQ